MRNDFCLHEKGKRMGQIEQVVKLTKKLEKLLEERGARGRGLHEKISSVSDQLTSKQIKSLRWIATLRNKTLHEDGFVIKKFEDFERTAKRLINELKIPEGDEGIGIGWPLVAVVIILLVLYILF